MHCKDCGTKIRHGLCESCHEEAYIYVTQYEPMNLPNPSEKFMEQVREQLKDALHKGYTV